MVFFRLLSDWGQSPSPFPAYADDIVLLNNNFSSAKPLEEVNMFNKCLGSILSTNGQVGKKQD